MLSERRALRLNNSSDALLCAETKAGTTVEWACGAKSRQRAVLLVVANEWPLILLAKQRQQRSSVLTLCR